MGSSKVRRETSAGGVVFRRQETGPLFLLILDGHRAWGFPKGHLRPRESPEEAARREILEETGLDDVVLLGELAVIDWFFRTRKTLIHKFCHLYLFESPAATARPQLEEGITACQWYPFAEAVELMSYENARGVLRQAAQRLGVWQAEGAGAAER